MRPEAKVKTERPDKFKRWMIASFFLIPLVLFGSVAGYYYLHAPVKMWVAVRLLGYNRTRNWAQGEIYEAGYRAIPYLVGGFGSINGRVRSQSYDFLVGHGPRHWLYLNVDKSFPHLIKGFWSRNENKRLLSARALEILRRRGVVQYIGPPPLHIELLCDPEARVRMSAVRPLDGPSEKNAVPKLIRVLSDPDGEVRRSAVWALG